MNSKKTPIINDFRAGELTPNMDTRVDIKDYYRGCRILENAMPIIEGGVARVPGTYYVRPVKTDEGWNIRVTKSGTGTGVVTSDVVGINCGASCYSFFIDGITVLLTATPDGGCSFTAWSGDGTGLVTRSLLMDGNKVVNAEFSAIPLNTYLIGWYKFNEGSGVVAINSATNGVLGGGLLPNLDVSGDLDVFWNTEPGFGYSGDVEVSPPICWASKILSSPRDIGDKWGVGIFYKRIDEIHAGGYVFELCTPTEEKIVWTCAGGALYAFQFDDTVVVSRWDMSLFNWHFLFFDDSNYPRIIKPDGTMASGDLELTRFVFSLKAIAVGVAYLPPTDEYDGGSYGSFGDFIIYNNKNIPISTPGSGYKPWSQWYDELRSRYGMAARSGW